MQFPWTAIGPEHELALLLTGTARSRQSHSEQIRDLAEKADYDRLEELLRSQGTLAMIGQRLREVSPLTLPTHFAESVEQFAAAARRQGLSQQMLTLRLTSALEEAGIASLPLKGPLLGERLHGDIGARASADIDLLVAESDLAAAVEVVSSFGYRPHPFTVARGGNRPALHECLVHPSDLPQVEIHWRVHWYATRFSAEALARSTPRPDGFRRAALADELVTLLLFYARDGFAGLRLAADLAAWWDGFGTELDPAELSGLAGRHPQMERALATAAVLADQVAGVPADALFPEAMLSRASIRAMRLANWPPKGNWGQISANVSLIDLALAPAGETRSVIHRHLLLDGEDLLKRWPDSGQGPFGRLWLKTGLRAAHVARALVHYAIAATFLILRRPWSPMPTSAAR